MEKKRTAIYNYDSFLDWILYCLELDDIGEDYETSSYVNHKGRLVLMITR
jgi:hypothetical protein